MYILVFGIFVDRPLSLGLIRLEMLQKTSRLAALPTPKLVILAGSNGPYSHSCAVLSAMLGLPCENAGIAVGIGLDELFARYAPFLRPGDVVYMPMELQQYTATSAQYRMAVDGEVLLRHDRALLGTLPASRIVGALFCCNLSDLLDSLAEMPIARLGMIQPARQLGQEYNVEGDRIDNQLAFADADLLRLPHRPVPPASDIQNGYGSALITRFITEQTERGVTIIGGLPTDVLGAGLSRATVDAVSRLYLAHGGHFLALPSFSEYPVQDFFNSEDHLAQPCQYMHSIALAVRLAALLNRPVVKPDTAILRIASQCPSWLVDQPWTVVAER